VKDTFEASTSLKHTSNRTKEWSLTGN